MLWKLNATIIHAANDIILYGLTSLSITPGLRRPAIESFLSAIDTGMTAQELEQTAQHDPLIAQLIQTLQHKHLLIPYADRHRNTPQEKSYDFFCHYLATQQTCLHFNPDIHITILGCGGVGANIAQQLIVSGFSRFTLVDSDRVQASNLNRQLPYRIDDVGQPKTLALATYLRTLQPTAEIHSHQLHIHSKQSLVDTLGETDLIIAGIDSPPVLSSVWATEYALERQTPITFGSVGYDSLQVGPFLTDAPAQQRYIAQLQSITTVPSSPIRGSLASTNGLLSAMMSNEIINYFYRLRNMISLNKRVILDPFTLEKIGEHSYAH